VESAGYRPVGPASVSAGFEVQYPQDLRYELFFLVSGIRPTNYEAIGKDTHYVIIT
jgi:hypothetical protein